MKPLHRRTLLLAATAALSTFIAGCAAPAKPPLPRPEIIPVGTWGGIPGPAPADPQKTITQITLHHQGETWKPGRDVPSYLRNLQKWSRETKKWADIPYHYVIDPEGRIYAARPEEQAGDTNTEYNPRGHVLTMVLGNFEEVEPNAAQLRAVVELMAWQAQQHGLTAEAIASHKDFSKQTVCPGKNLYRYLENGWIKKAVAERLATGGPVNVPVLPGSR